MTKNAITWKDGRKIHVGDAILIKTMGEEENYDGRYGKVTFIDDAGYLRGTWGGLSIIPGDEFVVIHCNTEK